MHDSNTAANPTHDTNGRWAMLADRPLGSGTFPHRGCFPHIGPRPPHVGAKGSWPHEGAARR